ncbi:hypothetical protein [Streptomyces sp. NPDC005251]|uniref:hypothetical protein n=1 Tax=unclassified Streptomyces TaxID=2593676 RepID=UPI0033B52474
MAVVAPLAGDRRAVCTLPGDALLGTPAGAAPERATAPAEVQARALPPPRRHQRPSLVLDRRAPGRDP